MAIADGVNAGRTGHAARQSPSTKYNGRQEPGTDPTNEPGQLPSHIFGIPQTYSTGAPGTRGASAPPRDVTVMPGQLDEGLAGVSGSEITSTGAPGSTGASNGNTGDTVTYTDPFGIQGGVTREVTVKGQVSGVGDWTQANDMGYAAGPTLPILQNARPTSSGAGQGRVSTHRSGRGNS